MVNVLQRTRPGTAPDVASELRPLVEAYFGGPPPIPFVFWDGSTAGPPDGPATVRFRSADALRRILWAPGELGVGRAFVAGDIDIDGDVIAGLAAMRDAAPRQLRSGARAVPAAVRAAIDMGMAGRPLPPPAVEVGHHFALHTKASDRQAISHHYDVSNRFYELVLGPAMTYSCARFVDPAVPLGPAALEEAQRAKHDLVCRKLALRPGMRVLDVGCGWGSLALHAAGEFGAQVVGITISEEQAKRARERVDSAGLGDRIDIRLQDYRDLGGESFDAISSIGMFEHVGSARMGEYFRVLREVLRPGGRFLNHAISVKGRSKLGPRTFMYRYVFPDAELIDVADVVREMEGVGLEVRDVESLREHYEQTLRCWLGNLDAHWDEAVAEVGEARARVWQIYMAGSALGFADGGLGIHQTLGVLPRADGTSGMPPTRASYV